MSKTLRGSKLLCCKPYVMHWIDPSLPLRGGAGKILYTLNTKTSTDCTLRLQHDTLSKKLAWLRGIQQAD